MIKDWLDEYQPRTQTDAHHALREIMQQTALAGLQRSGFFEKAAFYGGTALRIFYGLERFSEDLDFSLLKSNPDFLLEPHLASVITEFNALGMQVSVKEKIKNTKTNIDSAFLKSETIWNELVLEGVVPQARLSQRPDIKIKIEVDTRPPLGFNTEEKLLLRPFSFYVKCFKLEDLFAGKMHALLFRNWRQRVKGRDWFDMEWYIKKGVPLNLHHFLIRARENGNWAEKTISKEQLLQLLKNKINTVSFNSAKTDIVRFVSDDKTLNIWSAQYFNDLISQMRFKK